MRAGLAAADPGQQKAAEVPAAREIGCSSQPGLPAYRKALPRVLG